MQREELTATGRVILGMIGLGRRTGYEIKQLVDKSTRHFWAASYGQIYPELRRLEHAGLLAGRSQPTGGRSRRVYELTEAGRRVLREWLCADEELAWEMRDEGLLKLFFSDLVEPGRRAQLIAEMREGLLRTRAQLAELTAAVPAMPDGPRLTLEFGLGLTQWMIDWCEMTARRLEEEAA